MSAVRRNDYQKFNSEDFEKMKNLKLKDIEILGDRIISCTIDVGSLGYSYCGVDHWISTYELSEDLKSIISEKDLFYNARGEVVQYSTMKDGRSAYKNSANGRSFGEQTTSFLLDEEKSSYKSVVKTEVIASEPQPIANKDLEKQPPIVSANGNDYLLKYFEEKILKEQLERENVKLNRTIEDRERKIEDRERKIEDLRNELLKEKIEKEVTTLKDINNDLRKENASLLKLMEANDSKAKKIEYIKIEEKIYKIKI